MQKIAPLIILILIGFSCFAQNKNSKAGDWYFFYQENAQLNFVNLNTPQNPIPRFSNLTSLVESRDSVNNKLEIKLRPTLRNFGNDFSVVSQGEWDDCYARPSILGEKIIYSDDSLFVQIEDNKYLIFPSFHNQLSYPFFKNDSTEIQANVLNHKIRQINGFQDSLITIKLKAIKGFQPKATNLINNIYLTYGKQSGFIETPDFFQLNNVFEVSKIQNYILNFSNNPLIGIKSLKNKSFYNFQIGDVFYFDGYPLQEFGGFMRIITGKDSITNPQTTNFSYYEYSYHRASSSNPLVYFEGYKNISIINDEIVNPPFCSVFVDDTSFSYSSGNIFYLNNRACFQYKNEIPFINEGSMDSVFLFFEASIKDEYILCEDLGLVHDFLGEYSGVWSTERGFVLIDYKKGSEVLTGIESPFWETTLEQDFFPNPTNGSLYFKGHERISDLKIFDTTGKLVVNKPFLFSDFLNLNGLAEGAYFITFQKNYQGYTQKLIIER